MTDFLAVAVAFVLASVGCGVQFSERNQAANSPTTIAVGSGPGSLGIADFNGDGKLDIAVANGGSDNVTILLGDGKGGFAEAPGSPFPAGRRPNDLCVGDFNRDGKLDLAFANHDEKHLTVLLGDGRGGFAPAPGSPVAVLSRPHTHGVAAGDFNGDGNVDLTTESWEENKVTVVFGDGRGRFASPGVQFNVGQMPYQRLRAADVNGDGNADILTTNLRGRSVTVLLSDGKGGFHQAHGSPFPCGKTPFGLAIGDVNGDGKPDLAIGNWAGQPGKRVGEGATVLLGDGNGGFAVMPGSPFPTGDGPGRVAIGDVDGDGAPDVVVANYLSRSVTVLRGDKKTLRPVATIAVGDSPQGLALADLDGDGKAEIVVANSGDNTISIVHAGASPAR